jgi:uncharacterized membrane protein
MKWVFACCVGLLACDGDPVDETNLALPADTEAIPELADTLVTLSKDTATYASYAPRQIKKPSGIYRLTLPYEGVTLIQTVAFYSGTFRLQEEFTDNPDSVTVTEGTWAPSQGFIWLYKDHLVRGRYTWAGDTLQYYSARLKRKFSMTPLTPANNKTWQEGKSKGAVLYGIGTEPFWSVEINDRDSIQLNMPDWSAPLRTKLSATDRTDQGTVYTAETDSLQVTVLPYFCSDGMSDFTYSHKVIVRYKDKVYKGCGARP